MSPYDDDAFSAGFAPSRGPNALVDFCTREGAQALKDKIEAYWRDRGHPVMVSLENVGFHPAIRAARYEVRSDMVNGMPRSAIASAKKPASAPQAVEEVDLDDFADDVAFDD
jgi:hypothetical protein